MRNVKPVYWHKIEDKSILVFDNVFSGNLQQALAIYISGLPYQRRPSFDNELSVAIENDEFHRLPRVYSALESLRKHYYPKMCRYKQDQKLSHVYCASVRYGDQTMIHHDVDCKDCITFLYYGNLHWFPEWGGETIFFDREKNAVAAVNPKPGRLVLFNAKIFHRTGIPLRDCPSARLTMSIFYRCEKMLASNRAY